MAACASRPAGRPRVTFPFWSVREGNALSVGCAQVIAWVSKSGKDGAGVSLQVASPEGACPVEIIEARIDLPRERIPAEQRPPPRMLGRAEVVRAYLPFLFGNDASWNRGEALATLVLRIQAGGVERELTLPMWHRPYSFLREPLANTTVAPTVEKLELKQLYPPPPASPTALETPPAPAAPASAPSTGGAP